MEAVSALVQSAPADDDGSDGRNDEDYHGCRAGDQKDIAVKMTVKAATQTVSLPAAAWNKWQLTTDRLTTSSFSSSFSWSLLNWWWLKRKLHYFDLLCTWDNKSYNKPYSSVASWHVQMLCICCRLSIFLDLLRSTLHAESRKQV